MIEIIKFKGIIHKATGTFISYQEWLKLGINNLTFVQDKILEDVSFTTPSKNYTYHNARELIFNEDFEVIYNNDFNESELYRLYDLLYHSRLKDKIKNMLVQYKKYKN